jgi:hypothetical protein
LTLLRSNRLQSSFATPTNQQLESRIAVDICHSPNTSEEGRGKGGRRGASSEREGGLKSRQAFSHLAVECQSPATDTLESVVLHRQARELLLLREDAVLIQRPLHSWPPPDALSLDPNILGVCVCVVSVCRSFTHAKTHAVKERETHTYIRTLTKGWTQDKHTKRAGHIHTHTEGSSGSCALGAVHTHTHAESERGRDRQMHTQACDTHRTGPSHQNAFCTCKMCSLCLPSTGAASTFCQQALFVSQKDLTQNPKLSTLYPEP